MLVLHSVVLHSAVDLFYLNTLCHGLCYDFVELVVMDFGESDVVKENDLDPFPNVLVSYLEV